MYCLHTIVVIYTSIYVPLIVTTIRLASKDFILNLTPHLIQLLDPLDPFGAIYRSRHWKFKLKITEINMKCWWKNHRRYQWIWRTIYVHMSFSNFNFMYSTKIKVVPSAVSGHQPLPRFFPFNIKCHTESYQIRESRSEIVHCWHTKSSNKQYT